MKYALLFWIIGGTHTPPLIWSEHPSLEGCNKQIDMLYVEIEQRKPQFKVNGLARPGEIPYTRMICMPR